MKLKEILREFDYEDCSEMICIIRTELEKRIPKKKEFVEVKELNDIRSRCNGEGFNGAIEIFNKTIEEFCE